VKLFTTNFHSYEIYEVKKSKFIAHLFPYRDFEKILKSLKIEHPKARHFVYAFRYLNEFQQIVEGSSDDGEPKGTSGKPTLNVLIGHNLINIGIITVRYFGGIKLGTGGLVKAYSSSANLVVNSSELFEYIEKEKKIFQIGYSDISKFEYQISKLNISILSKEFNESGGVFILEGDRESFGKLKT